MLGKVRDIQRQLSWKLGFGRGKAGRVFRCPWWADRIVFSVAYLQGQGVEFPSASSILGKMDHAQELGDS